MWRDSAISYWKTQSWICCAKSRSLGMNTHKSLKITITFVPTTSEISTLNSIVVIGARLVIVKQNRAGLCRCLQTSVYKEHVYDFSKELSFHQSFTTSLQNFISLTDSSVWKSGSEQPLTCCNSMLSTTYCMFRFGFGEMHHGPIQQVRCHLLSCYTK